MVSGEFQKIEEIEHRPAKKDKMLQFINWLQPSWIVLFLTDFFRIDYIVETRSSLLYLVLLAVFGTAMAKTMFNKLVKISSPIFSSSVTYLIPIVAIFWGVLDGETIYFD